MKSEAAEATIAAIANKATYAGGTTAFVGGFLTPNELAAFGGLIVAAIGLAVQWYYKRKADRRHAEEHELRMANLREGHEG